MKEKITELFKNKNTAKLLFIVGIIGILLIFASSFIPEKDKTEKTASFSEEAYRSETEEAVARMVEGICGDPTAIVTVTLKTGVVYEYADQLSQSNAEDSGGKRAEKEQTYITVKDAGGSEKPLVITAYMPEIRGVSVICNADEKDAEEIKNAVCAALDISSRQIYIGRKTGP